MRKVIVSNFVTLDGYYDSLDGGFADLFRYRHPDYQDDDQFDHHNTALLNQADVLLLAGRESYLGNKAYWSNVPGDPEATPIRLEFARRMALIPKVVVSDQLTAADLDPWASTTRIVRLADAKAQVAALRTQEGGHIFVYQSRALWNELLAHGLVDELHLTTFPLLAGSGRLLFTGRPPVQFRLIRTQSWPGSGNVLSVWDVTGRQAESQGV